MGDVSGLLDVLNVYMVIMCFNMFAICKCGYMYIHAYVYVYLCKNAIVMCGPDLFLPPIWILRLCPSESIWNIMQNFPHTQPQSLQECLWV